MRHAIIALVYIVAASLNAAEEARPITAADPAVKRQFAVADRVARQAAAEIEELRKAIADRRACLIKTVEIKKEMRKISDNEIAPASRNDLLTMTQAAAQYNAALSRSVTIDSVSEIYDRFPALERIRRHPCPEWSALDEITRRCHSVSIVEPKTKRD